MNLKSIIECEAKGFEKLNKYQLPNHYKKIGIAILIISFISIFINGFSLNQPEVKIISKFGILIGLLIISISKELLEDELVIKLRMQSYTFAFIAAVGYSLMLPFINYLFDITFQSANATLKEIGDFTILWMLLIVQVLYFEVLKKAHK
ncbi:MAG: hypothetical protein H6613_04640 [Ignavibacteriales bacterium]|nr:hypothetical protein [Ignavibacteriota bacterium]MCB9247868.1 hypothetical protein [Ignavibacteriales bacterium]